MVGFRSINMMLINEIYTLELRIGESLFTLLASLTHAYHYLMTLITLNIEVHNSLSFL